LKTISAILIKFLFAFFIVSIALNWQTGLNVEKVLIIALVASAVLYLIGDLVIMRMNRNIVAAVLDAALAFAVIYLFNYLPGFGTIYYFDAAICAGLIGIEEWFFHKAISRRKKAAQAGSSGM